MSSKLFVNALFYCQDGYYDWMVVTNSTISQLGRGEPPHSEDVIDLNGNLVLPGLHDSHIHVYSLGRLATRLLLHGTGSVIELQYKLEEFVKSKSDSEWIIGHGWDQDLMEDGRYPSRQDLDRIESTKPVLLYRACNHIAVVNTRALEIMNITSNTPDPEGGKIDRDKEGQPTGILREKGLSLVSPYISSLDDESRMEYYKKGLQICLQKGITSVHTNDSQAWNYYRQLAESDQLSIRVFLTLSYSDLDGPEYLPKFNEKIGKLTCKRVKLFSDGSLGAETAALRQNYQNTDNSGLLIDKPEVLTEKISRIHNLGYQLEVHAIGDRAVEVVIDAFEGAGIRGEHRPIITHCQILGDDLIERMANNGYIANIQPPFVPTDARWAEKRLGDTERLEYAYAWKTLIERGVIAAGGSDAPIEDADPFWGLYCALYHPGPDGRTWKSHEQLSWNDAVKLYTHNGAYAVGMENRLGILKEGFNADFVVVDSEILDNHEQLKNSPLKQVWVAGICQYKL